MFSKYLLKEVKDRREREREGKYREEFLKSHISAVSLVRGSFWALFRSPSAQEGSGESVGAPSTCIPHQPHMSSGTCMLVPHQFLAISGLWVVGPLFLVGPISPMFSRGGAAGVGLWCGPCVYHFILMTTL